MSAKQLPAFMEERKVSNEEALRAAVRSGMTVASGFATSEPHTFYDTLWDHIQREDIVDLRIRQALFMAPHKVCLGDALESKGLLNGLVEMNLGFSLLANVARSLNQTTRKLEGLKRLIDHYREMQERRIQFVSAFIGATTNTIIPDNPMTKMVYPEYVGRNTSRMGITDMQSIHFPDAVDAMAYTPEGEPKIDTFVAVMTPPDENGELSHGPANGANQEVIERLLAGCDMNLILYVNSRYPFTRGYEGAGNTIHQDAFRALAKAGKLFVVEDEGKVPALPADSFKHPQDVELKIAENVVNHVEVNRRYTDGRAIQVGFGGTGVLAIRALKESSWTGRSYTEMLEPFTLDLFDAGKIAGSHFIETDGRRTMLDGKMVATFSVCEENSDFYDRISNNPAIVMAPASRVVIPEGFYGGLGINNCLAIDFHGHVNSGGRFKNHHSGIGGAAMIMRGLSKGGVAYLCCKSTFTGPDGKPRSSIMPFLPSGTTVSLVGPDLMGGRDGARVFLATEHGIAQLSGRSQSDFIRALLSVADPEFRDWLAESAWEEFRIRV